MVIRTAVGIAKQAAANIQLKTGLPVCLPNYLQLSFEHPYFVCLFVFVGARSVRSDHVLSSDSGSGRNGCRPAEAALAEEVACQCIRQQGRSIHFRTGSGGHQAPGRGRGRPGARLIPDRRSPPGLCYGCRDFGMGDGGWREQKRGRARIRDACCTLHCCDHC